MRPGGEEAHVDGVGGGDVRQLPGGRLNRKEDRFLRSP
jgi:hypothetical protein